MYLRIGLLPHIMEESLRWYQHLLAVAEQCTREGWEHAQVYLRYHATELGTIRRRSVSRSQLIMKVYIYLREASERNFTTVNLLEAEMQAYRKKLLEAETSVGTPRGGSPQKKTLPNTCGKCGSTDLHAGGRRKCVFQTLTDSQALKAAQWVHTQLKQDPKAEHDTTIKAAIEEFS